MQTHCPVCGNKFTWRERWLFSRKERWKRQAVPCPRCGTMLISNQDAWKLISTGSRWITGSTLAMVLIIFLDLLQGRPKFLAGLLALLVMPAWFYGMILLNRGRKLHHYELTSGGSK